MKQKLFEHLLTEFENECFDLLEQTTGVQLLEHSSYIPLLEHRGKPDPKKVAERKAVHRRGIERRKNAELRRKELEQKLKQKQNKNQNVKSTEISKKFNVPEKKEDAEKKANKLQDNISKTKKTINNKLRKLINSAPSEKAKTVAVNFKKSLEKLNKKDLKLSNSDALSKLTPGALKARKERELKNLRDDFESQLPDSERNWFRRHSEEICNHSAEAADNFFDLCGIKAVYDDVWKATDYVTGGLASKGVSRLKQKIFGKD